jgi:hypothetical protein
MSYYPWSFLHSASYDPPLEEVKKTEEYVKNIASLGQHRTFIDFQLICSGCHSQQDPLELEHLQIATHRGVLKPRTICKCFGSTGRARRTSVVDQSRKSWRSYHGVFCNWTLTISQSDHPSSSNSMNSDSASFLEFRLRRGILKH